MAADSAQEGRVVRLIDIYYYAVDVMAEEGIAGAAGRAAR